MKKLIRTITVLNFAFAIGTLSAQQVLPYTTEEGSMKTTSDNDDNVFIYGVGSAESLQLESLTAAGSLSAGLKLGQGLTANVTFNFGSQAVKNEKADSVPLSLFYFPDVANTAFAGGIDYSHQFGESKHNLGAFLEGSIQRRNIEKDSLTYEFGISNISTGLKYRWIHTKGEHKAIFTFGFLYNYVGINRNNSDAFNTLFDDYEVGQSAPVKRYFHGVSFLASLQLDDAIVFARTYTDVNQSGDLAFTVGIKAAATFFSF